MVRNILSFIIIGFLLTPAFSQIELALDTPTIGTPTIFGKYVISTRLSERDLTMSPDGSEIYYTGFSGNIFYIERQADGTWSLPEIASFSRGKKDIEPSFTPDGNRLFFSRNTGSNNDIYFVERLENGDWSSAMSAGDVINTDANEFYPSVAADGTLFYTANYTTGLGGEDIWMATFENGVYNRPTPLSGLSQSTDEFNAYIDPNQEFIYFGSFGRSDGKGGGDIYFSRKTGDTWGSGSNLSVVNTNALDYSPTLSPNGRFLFFTSQREPNQDNRESSTNIFDIETVLNRILEPRSTGSDIYWIGR